MLLNRIWTLFVISIFNKTSKLVIYSMETTQKRTTSKNILRPFLPNVSMLQTFRSFITHTTYEKLQCLTSSKYLPHLLIILKDYLLIVLTLGRRFCRKSFELYIDLIFINFVLIDKALAPHLLRNKLWKWPTALSLCK